MYVKNVANIDRERVEAGKNTHRQVLIGPEEGPNFAMRRFIIESGGSMPTHTNTVEHEQYVLSGRAKIGIGDKIFEVQKNDVIYIPANVHHWYENSGNEPFEFLCMVPNKPDIVKIIT